MQKAHEIQIQDDDIEIGDDNGSEPNMSFQGYDRRSSLPF